MASVLSLYPVMFRKEKISDQELVLITTFIERYSVILQ